MTKFVLVYSGGGMPETMSQADRDAVMADWGAWYGALGEAIVDGGNPFGASKTVTKAGVNDGPASSPPATGYTVIAADSLDAAAGMVANHPHIKHGGEVSVFETFEM